MNSLQKYIRELEEIYGSAVTYTKSSQEEQSLSLAPSAMREWYREFSSVELPFGTIYPIEEAVERSRIEPFQSEGWFCFGGDGYFSFWLCKLTPEEENLSFTTWDHDSGCDIDGAIYPDLIQFLEALQLEHAEERDCGRVVLTKLPEERSQCLLSIKKAFSLNLSSYVQLKENKTFPYVITDKIMFAQARKMILGTGFPECFLFIRGDN